MVTLMFCFLLSAASQPDGECPCFLEPSAAGSVQCAELNELSGIAASRSGDFLWGHNDHGNAARLYAFSPQGEHLGVCSLVDVVNNDWEDMAIGPGPDPNVNYIYIADTGNNDGLADGTFTVLRLPEPGFKTASQPRNIEATGIERLTVRYPDGLRHDCETLLVDPVNGDLYLCTRDRWNDDGGKMKVYCYPSAKQQSGAVYSLRHETDVQLSFSSRGSKKPDWEMAVGGDISPDGQFVIIRTTSKRKNGPKRILLWPRSKGALLADCFSRPPCVLDAADEEQGEAICFAADGKGFYTVSEGDASPIYYYVRQTQLSERPGNKQ